MENRKVKVISTINLKGGVGKTLMTIALAEFLALEFDRKVLLIDLDPQTNATLALMNEKDWLEKDKKGETLLQLFKDKLKGTSKFDIEKAIVKGASNIRGGIPNLDLLPSSLGLIDIQDFLILISFTSTSTPVSPVTILKEAINPIKNNYDFILIDCPPNLGIITLNGIYISNYYLIPCIPDILSTYGIPQILGRINKFKKKNNIDIEPLGIVISMYRAQTNLHNAIIEELENKAEIGEYPRVFNTKIPLATKAAESADFSNSVNTLKQKYGYDKLRESYSKLAQEVLRYV
jgi:chromosome partitioning protein